MKCGFCGKILEQDTGYSCIVCKILLCEKCEEREISSCIKCNVPVCNSCDFYDDERQGSYCPKCEKELEEKDEYRTIFKSEMKNEKDDLSKLFKSLEKELEENK